MGTCYSVLKEELVMRRHSLERDRQAAALTRNIDRQLKRFNNEEENVIKLLLLGSGNSGKSTILKQFKIFHNHGFGSDERNQVKRAMWRGAIVALKILVNGKDDLRYDESIFQMQQQQSMQYDNEDEAAAAMAAAAGGGGVASGALPGMHQMQQHSEMPMLPHGMMSGAHHAMQLPPIHENGAGGKEVGEKTPEDNMSPIVKRNKRLSINRGPKAGAGVGTHTNGNAPAHSVLMDDDPDALLGQDGVFTDHNGYGNGLPYTGSASTAATAATSAMATGHSAASAASAAAAAAAAMTAEMNANGYQQYYPGFFVSEDGHYFYQDEEDMQPYFDCLQYDIDDNEALYRVIKVPLKRSDHQNGNRTNIDSKNSTSSAPDAEGEALEGDMLLDMEHKNAPATSSQSPLTSKSLTKQSSLSKEKPKPMNSPPELSALTKMSLSGSKRGFDDSESIKILDMGLSGTPSAAAASDGLLSSPPLDLTGVPKGPVPEPIQLKPSTSDASFATHSSSPPESLIQVKQGSSFATGMNASSSTGSRDSDSWPTQQKSVDDFSSLQGQGSTLMPGRDNNAEGEVARMTVAQLLEKIWRHPIIQNVFRFESKMPSLEYPIAYTMQHIDRIARKDYIPTDQDVLTVRNRTEAVDVLKFKYEGRDFQMIDVGGQKAERRKWLSQFDNVDAVFFVVGLDGYDQVLAEDGKTNRLRDSLDLFREMCESPYFQYTNFIIFFNKRDIFKKKIEHVPLNACFKSYSGPQHDYEACITYIKKRFMDSHARHVERLRQLPIGRSGGRDVFPSCYPYVTCATDTEAFQFLVVTVQAIFLREGLMQVGISPS